MPNLAGKVSTIIDMNAARNHGRRIDMGLLSLRHESGYPAQAARRDPRPPRVRRRAPPEGICWDVLESMPYLNGFCEEVLRLYPTVPVTVREAQCETCVAGYRIPQGTLFLLVPYATNRNPVAWGADADKLMPERWIDTDPRTGAARPNKTGGTTSNFASLTFLHGPRACIGQDFAKAELRCAVAGLVGGFEIRLRPDQEEPRISGVITAKAEGGMRLLFKKAAADEVEM